MISDLSNISRNLLRLEQHPTDATVKRLTFHNEVAMQNVHECITLPLQGFAFSEWDLQGWPNYETLGRFRLMQMFSVVFVITSVELDSSELEATHADVFFFFDEQLISITPIVDKRGIPAGKADGVYNEYVEFRHPYNINTETKPKNNFRQWDVSNYVQDDENFVSSGKIFTLDAKVDDAYVQKFVTEFILRQEDSAKLYSIYLAH